MMPTIEIDSPELPVATRRAVSVRLTRWLSDRDVRRSNVVVRFRTEAENSAYSGGMPLDALPGTDAVPHHASVTCCVSPDRDEPFRRELAAEIADALGMHDRTPFLYVEFRPTPPSQVYVAERGQLRRGDEQPRNSLPDNAIANRR
jgi:hypothetical protein